MKLAGLALHRYRKARELSLPLQQLQVLIGPNASGKSNILDALRFMATGAMLSDFKMPVNDRGGFVHLAWKGEEASRVQIKLQFEDGTGLYDWNVRLEASNQYPFTVHETLERTKPRTKRETLLRNEPATKFWWSDTSEREEALEIAPTACALRIASANQGFPGRIVFEHIRNWVFCDPNPGVLRLPSSPDDIGYFDVHGRNLATRLFEIENADRTAFNRIQQTLRDVAGVQLSDLQTRALDDGRIAFVVNEETLRYRLNQPALSSGVLRVLAVVVALVGTPKPTLFAIEEPENYVHPGALEALIQLLVTASSDTQMLVTTHSPLVLDQLSDRPEVIYVVSGKSGQATKVIREQSPDRIKEALKASGFSLGQFWLTKGFRAAE